MQTRINRLILLQRKILINVAPAYRTISFTAICCITGEIPIHIKIEFTNEIKLLKTTRKRNNMENQKLRKKIDELQNGTMKRSQLEYSGSVAGRSTYEIILNVRMTYRNKYWYLNYYITLVLTGHGNFPEYLIICS